MFFLNFHGISFFCNLAPPKLLTFQSALAAQSYCPTWFRIAIRRIFWRKNVSGPRRETWRGKLRGTGQPRKSMNVLRFVDVLPIEHQGSDVKLTLQQVSRWQCLRLSKLLEWQNHIRMYWYANDLNMKWYILLWYDVIWCDMMSYDISLYKIYIHCNMYTSTTFSDVNVLCTSGRDKLWAWIIWMKSWYTPKNYYRYPKWWALEKVTPIEYGHFWHQCVKFLGCTCLHDFLILEFLLREMEHHSCVRSSRLSNAHCFGRMKMIYLV